MMPRNASNTVEVRTAGPAQGLRLALVTAFGLGLLPGAPGTWGTLLGVLLHGLVVVLLPAGVQTAALVLCLLAVSALNVILAPWAVDYWKCKDPGRFVLDEVAGYLIVPILFRHGALWQLMLAAFLLFRLFDIIKVPPARQIDRNMQSGWGILLDDLVSGAYAALALHGLLWVGLFPP